jgi:hypothetical protein
MNMTTTMTLTQSAACAQCGAALPAGATVRGPYRNGAVYGIACHSKAPVRRARRDACLGQRLSRYDKGGLYTPDGRLIGRVSCGCEDYPCCGH